MKPFIYFLLSLTLAGCVTAPKEPVLPPIQTATLEELVAKINTSSETLRSLKTTMRIRYKDRSAIEFRECEGLLAFEKPQKVYLKGYRPLVPTFFTLVSHEGNFWVHIPKENLVMTGQVSDLNASRNLEMGIRPDDLFRALEVKSLPSQDGTVQMQEEPAQYVLSVFRVEGSDKFLIRRLWVERYFLNVEREAYFDPFGLMEVQIYRRNYANEGPVYFPREINIFRQDRGTSLWLEAKKFLVNPELEPKLFKFETPEGASVETLKKVER